MDITATLDTDLPVDAIHAVVAELDTYPRWLEIVARSVRLADASDDGGLPSGRSARDALPAWSIDLRGQLGPLRRSKRLRMVRVIDTIDRVRFERAELDGRDHSAWVLEATIEPSVDGSHLTMRLHYGGSLWVPLLDRVLREEIERSRPRLVAEARSRADDR